MADTSRTITLYDLGPSPNSMKARIALNYKEIPFEKIPVNPEDRAAVIKASGQPLTPVLLHGGTVVYDSASILRYLEANFPGTRRLFTTDYNTMHEIEEWEFHGRRELNEPVEIIFGQCFGPEKSPAELRRACDLLHEQTAKVEARLAKGPWLVGDTMTAADVTCAPCVYYGMLPPEVAAISPLHQFFADSLKLGEGRDRTREWARKVMAFDR